MAKLANQSTRSKKDAIGEADIVANDESLRKRPTHDTCIDKIDATILRLF